ncbi:PRC-barrel domain-containing protein [Gymnodinialimonas sp. 57CJ19]|uniref:PRC-barrel domain-containing protein n=1 Tax=Gymnodinialimonas sp. 57CJ19 TaxID=3138498 RepID=UPI0031342408
MALDSYETNPLVSSADVNGTTVYGLGGEKVGEIDHLMIDKKSGKVSYAVMGFGGFLGMGEEHHPIPWNKLTYDTSKNGYVTSITEQQLTGAPERPNDWYRNRDWETRTHDYFAAPYYWI